MLKTIFRKEIWLFFDSKNFEENFKDPLKLNKDKKK